MINLLYIEFKQCKLLIYDNKLSGLKLTLTGIDKERNLRDEIGGGVFATIICPIFFPTSLVMKFKAARQNNLQFFIAKSFEFSYLNI